jgi:protocatechuate 3,4-dioxygenase beta subunit
VVSRIGPGRCDPLPGALVDLWQCDAAGIYSDVVDPRFNTVGQKFLRGNQTTDTKRSVRFRTIYPGWYQGRAVHIHFKIRTAAGAGRTAEFTSQVYFDEATTDRVYLAEQYGGAGSRRTMNSADRIFQNGGNQLLLLPGAVSGGYEAEFAVGLQLD